MLPHSAWVEGIPGLEEQTEQWLRGLPDERARLGRQARTLATPALHPAGIGRLAQVAGRVIGAAAGWATVDVGRAVYRSIFLGERDDTRVAAAVERAQELVRDSGPVYVKLGQFISTAQGLLPGEVVELFDQLVLEEMDFRLEALNMVEIGLASEDAGMFEALRVPRPVPGLVTQRVLVMEYLPGAPYTDAAGHFDADVDPAAIIRLGIQGVLEHTLVYGIFHGDLHAGNVFLEPDGRFVLLDFGIVGRLDARQRAALVQFMMGVGMWDARAQLEGLREFGAIPADTDITELTATLEALDDQQHPDVVTHEQIVEGMGEVMRILVAHGFRLPKAPVLFLQNLLHLNGLAATLAPDLNLLGEVDPIFQYFAAKYEQEMSMFRPD